MEREVKIPSAWSSTSNRVFVGVLVASIALLAAALPLAIATHATTGTFHTTDLIVDNSSTTGTLTVKTGAGQAALFSTKRAASTDGDNLCGGGGCQSVAYDGANSFSGSTNTSYGIGALQNVTTGNNGTAVGVNALSGAWTGEGVVAVGNNAGRDQTTGFDNVWVGTAAGLGATTAGDDVAVGRSALQGDGITAVTGHHNTAIGVNTMGGHATTAEDNTTVGLDGLIAITTGYQNTCVGMESCALVSTADSNAIVGAHALENATTGVRNTAVGANSLRDVTTGDHNVAIGRASGGGITTGRANTIIGAETTGLAANLSNNIILADGDGVIRWQCDATGAWDAHTALIHNVVNPVSAQDAATKAYVDAKASTIQSSVYYADGTDGTCAFDGVTTPVCGASLVSGVYTLTRDIAPNIMTVAAGVTVREDNFRIMVYTSLTGGGAGATISNSGFTSGAGGGDPRLPGNCGGTNSHYFQACSGQGGAGANGTGAGNNGQANAGAIPQWPAQGAAAAGTSGAGHGQGGGGGTAGANAGGTGGSIANPSVNVGYFTAVGGWSGRYDSYGNQWALYGTGGGGGGCTGGACTGGGGGGAGGIDLVATNQCLGTISIEANGGNGGNGVLAGGTSAGGGAGAGGGIVVLIYSHRSAGCTTSVAGGTHGTSAGTAGNAGDGTSGTTLLYNLSGDGS